MLNSFLKESFGKDSIDGTFLPLFYARDKEDLGIGDIGSLFKAVELTHELGQNLLEILPITLSSAFESPYSVLSSRCFNTLYISIRHLLQKIPCSEALNYLNQNKGKINELRDQMKVQYAQVRETKTILLRMIFNEFEKNTCKALKASLSDFKNEQKEWLEDHLLYILIREKMMKDNPATGWDFRTWPDKIRSREPKTLEELKKDFRKELDFQIFLQWSFWEQWHELQAFAKEKKVALMGDIPYAVDGADIWMDPEIFGLKGPDYKRTFTQGVPPDFFSEFGQYWQFYAFDWSQKKTINFLKERLEWNQKLFNVIRLDHVLGYYRYYLFFEDPSNTATLKALGIWERIKEIRDEGVENPERLGDYAWKAYKVMMRAMKHKRKNLFSSVIEDYFSDEDELNHRESNMLLVAREAGKKTPVKEWLRQYCVEKSVFEGKPSWDFQKISKDQGYQDHVRMCQYLFASGEWEIQETDSVRPCFFRKAPGEKLMKEFLNQADTHKSILIMEALGVVPQWIFDSLNNIKAINYIPMIYGMTPEDPGNPFFKPNHQEESFITFALHDSETLSGWWNVKPLEEKQKLLDYLFGKDEEQASDHREITYPLQKQILSILYESKSRLKVLLWTDIFLCGDEYAINKPGNQTGQWMSRMPKDADLDELIKAVKGGHASETAKKAVHLIRELKKVKE